MGLSTLIKEPGKMWLKPNFFKLLRPETFMCIGMFWSRNFLQTYSFSSEQSTEVTIMSLWILTHFIDVLNLLICNYGDWMLSLWIDMPLYVIVCKTSMTTLYNDKYVIVHWHTICSDSPLEGLTVDWKFWKYNEKRSQGWEISILDGGF